MLCALAKPSHGFRSEQRINIELGESHTRRCLPDRSKRVGIRHVSVAKEHEVWLVGLSGVDELKVHLGPAERLAPQPGGFPRDIPIREGQNMVAASDEASL